MNLSFPWEGLAGLAELVRWGMGTECEYKSHQALALYCPCFFMAINLLCASNPLCPQKEQLLRPPSSSRGTPGSPAHHQEPGMSQRVVGNTTGAGTLCHISPAQPGDILVQNTC